MEGNESNQSHWIPLADLMTGLMMIFMLVAAAFMLRVEKTTTLVVKEYVETKDALKEALQKEFQKDFEQWNAKLLGDMTIQFKNPDFLFATGSAELKPKFRDILDNFIPRYVRILTSDKFKKTIKELRIEGHTSTFWNNSSDKQTAYFLNMGLSQERTRSVLEYILLSPKIQNDQAWLREHFTANGLSSSRPVHFFVAGKETDKIDENASQRVEFRIVTKADEAMDKIVNDLNSNSVKEIDRITKE